MAEGLFRAKASDMFETHSAGTKPKGLNPLAVQAMKEIGIDISHHQSKDVSVYEGQPFDLVITVCDNAKESCPVFPGAHSVHWSTPDPEDLESFRKVRDALSLRIDELLASFKSENS
jgi:arsenate reductase